MTLAKLPGRLLGYRTKMNLLEPRPRLAAESVGLVPYPALCLSAVLSSSRLWGRYPVAEARVSAALGLWWSSIPARARTLRTDYLASRILAVSTEPLALVHWWHISGDWCPWLAVPRMLDGLTTLARVLAENPDLADALRVLDDLETPRGP